LTKPEAKYLVGWSHGKETLKPGVYDTLKGSYYVNCAFYQDPSLEAAPVTSEFPDFPEYTAPNVWPAESVLPGFRQVFEELCTLIIDTAVLVARACDRYAGAHIDGYEPGYLEKVVSTSMTTKARLLHYFPLALKPPPPESAAKVEPVAPLHGSANLADADDDDDDSWCATHVDHGCLTGLTSALFIDETGGALPAPSLPLPELKTFASSPDPAAGLYIRSRTGQTTKVGFPAETLAFQTGESLERITRGKFKAVPHFVRGPSMETGRGVARNTLAVFTQPNLGDLVDTERGTTFANFAGEVINRNT
jgi:isopenicillin N synthase-like dioxygenase